MKKLTLGIGICILAAVSSFAVELMVSQVTYFPLAYIGYHTLQVEKLEVGVGRAKSTAKQLGNALLASPNRPLVVSDTLTINSGVVASFNNASVFEGPNTFLNFGTVNNFDSKITFTTNLRIGTLAKLKNLNSTNMHVIELRLGEGDANRHKFPDCTAGPKDPPYDYTNMYWVPLRLYEAKDAGCKWYLTCGKPAAAAENYCKEKTGVPVLP